MDSTTYDIALLFHLLGAIAFFSGIAVAGVAHEAARRREHPGEISVLLGMARTGVLLVAAGTLLLGGFGLWLVHLGHWGYGSGWIDSTIGLFVLAVIAGGLGGRKLRTARELATRLAAAGEPATPELRALLEDRSSRVHNYAALALVLAVLVLMVFK